MSNCPNCNSFKPHFSNVETCSVCGLGRTIGATISVEDQNYIDTENPGGQLRPWYFNFLYRQYYRNQPIGRSLDVGCGRGELVRLLNNKGWSANGIDSYREFPGDQTVFFRSRLEDFPASEPFDIVTLVHSLEHIENVQGAFSHLRRLVKPNGRILIIVPNFAGLWSRLTGEDWTMLNTDEHIYHFTITSLLKLITDEGFNTISWLTYSRYAPSPLQILLARRRFYEEGWGSVQPFRSLIFRTNTLFRPVLNKIIDLRKDGAEIQLLATRSTASQRHG